MLFCNKTIGMLRFGYPVSMQAQDSLVRFPSKTINHNRKPWSNWIRSKIRLVYYVILDYFMLDRATIIVK